MNCFYTHPTNKQVDNNCFSFHWFLGQASTRITRQCYLQEVQLRHSHKND